MAQQVSRVVVPLGRRAPASLRHSRRALRRQLHASTTSRAAGPTSSSHAAAEKEVYTPTGFSTPFWRATFVLAALGLGAYEYNLASQKSDPSRPLASPFALSSSASAAAKEKDDDDEGYDDRPFLTRYLAYYTTPTSVYKQRNEKHLDLAREKAEEKLLFQDAERPVIHRLRYTSTFEQASPHKLELGAQTDLSDLRIKKDSE